MNPFYTLYYRSLVSLIFNSSLIIYLKREKSIIPLEIKKEIPLIVRGILGIFATSLYM